MTEEQQSQSPKERKSIHDIRNQDLVSRLLAATPPYLYSAPVGSNNFFFSDMLRSLVQARNNENARNLQMQQAAMARRPRKRSWSQHRPYYESNLKERKDEIEKTPSTLSEKPLELTNKQLFPISAKYSKFEAHHHNTSLKDGGGLSPNINNNNKITQPTTMVQATKHHHQHHQNNSEYEQHLSNETTATAPIPDPPAASLPPSELVLPPPPPVWYPPLYPPYGIDPLHFFIDLRVSGHIYDRKKENVSPLANSDNNNVTTTTATTPSSSSDNENFTKQRHASAFSVPPPRNESKTASVINLSASNNNAVEKLECYRKYYDLTETKENHPNSKNSAYPISRIYTGAGGYTSSRDSIDENIYEIDSKSEQDTDEIERSQSKENLTHIDVEMIDSVKSRSDTERTHSPSDMDSTQIHQID